MPLPIEIQLDQVLEVIRTLGTVVVAPTRRQTDLLLQLKANAMEIASIELRKQHKPVEETLTATEIKELVHQRVKDKSWHGDKPKPAIKHTGKDGFYNPAKPRTMEEEMLGLMSPKERLDHIRATKHNNSGNQNTPLESNVQEEK
jgi:virulence-associated protein VagC